MANPLTPLLASMNQKTVTLGWDAIVAYNASSLNDLFAQQFVNDVRHQQDLTPINATIALSQGVSVETVNLTLGPPLISFTPGVNQQATVTMNFVAGEILVQETSGKTQYVTGYQNILPGDDYQLTMTVQLDQAAGADNHNVVSIDVSAANNYAANLLPGTSAAAYLGQYFGALFKKETGSAVQYQLGTMVTGSSQNLTPVSFDIRTQVYPGTSGSNGAVLLLIATTYNPNGGDIPAEDFPYLIPDGYDCALVVRSATFFGNIVSPYYTKTLVGSPGFNLEYFSGSTPAAYLSCVNGTLNAGSFSSRWYSGGQSHGIWSGSVGLFSKNILSIEVPYSGWTLQPENNLLTMNWSNNFTQEFGGYISVPRSEGLWSDNHVGLTVTGYFTVQAAASNQQVTFSGGSSAPNVNVNYQSSDWLSKYFGNGAVRDRAASQMAGIVQPVVQKVMDVPVPEVNAFAVSHLLFPTNNVLNYSDAYVPGDLAVFGQIQPNETAFTLTPLCTVVGAGQQVAFQLVGGTGSASWGLSAQVGSITQAGVYTAPPVVPKAIPIVVTATEGGNMTTAVVTVVPDGVSVSPAYSMVFDGGSTTDFQATVLDGQAATWSMSPADGSMGSISATGVYSAPATMPSTVQTATVTATSGNSSDSALVCLADVEIALTMVPTYAILGPNGQQTFTAGSANPTWSLQPATGTITQDGVYQAPSAVATPQTVLVVAALDDQFFGIAPVILQPPS